VENIRIISKSGTFTKQKWHYCMVKVALLKADQATFAMQKIVF